MNATTHSIPAALLLNVTPFEAEVMAQVAANLNDPLPARERALVDEAIRLYALGRVLP